MAIEDIPLNNNLDERLVVGQTVFNEADLLGLTTLVATVFTNTHATPRKLGDTSGYIVPVSTKFVVKAVHISNAGSGVKVWGLGSAASDVGFDSSSAPTSPEQSGLFNGYKASPSQMEGNDLTLSIPTGRYLYFTSNDGSNATIIIYGKEVAV